MSLKWMPRGVAFLVGAASLVQEVLWVRLAGFATGGLPETFATILTLYLLGIAVGAQLGRRLCVGRVLDIRRRASLVLLLSALVDIAAPFLFSWGIGFLPVTVAMLPLVIATAALKSALFPVVHHLGSNDAVAWKGGSFSKVYFANVAGCTLGPLIVTLWLMDVMVMEQLFVGVATVTAVAGMWLAGLRLLAVPAVVVAIAALVLQPALPALASRIVMATGGAQADWLLERKEGIIHTIADPQGDIVFGGNVYDGRINVDLRSNSNKIDRVYAAMAAVPNPKRVLVIGLGGGSWTRVIASFPTVDRVDVVETNPGYLELIAGHPQVAPILQDPRVHIHIDDGRRWLRAQGGGALRCDRGKQYVPLAFWCNDAALAGVFSPGWRASVRFRRRVGECHRVSRGPQDGSFGVSAGLSVWQQCHHVTTRLPRYASRWWRSHLRDPNAWAAGL
ncbi:hypothetical protein NO935_06975 [Xanthomonas oryzae pv. oryzae]|nr:hypothetical protein NO935_06975 [Xanthomonas oryzae pv. oryzae]